MTVHFANEIYDNGPIIAQRALAVEEGWDVDTLEEHIHAIEHVLYPCLLYTSCPPVRVIPAGMLRFGRAGRYTCVASLGLMVMLWKRFSM